MKRLSLLVGLSALAILLSALSAHADMVGGCVVTSYKGCSVCEVYYCLAGGCADQHQQDYQCAISVEPYFSVQLPAYGQGYVCRALNPSPPYSLDCPPGVTPPGAVVPVPVPGVPIPASLSYYSESDFVLTWSAGNGGAPTSYELQYYSTLIRDPQHPYYIDWQTIYSGLSTGYYITANNDIAYYRVRACNASGCSDYSDQISVQTYIPGTAPPVPPPECTPEYPSCG